MSAYTGFAYVYDRFMEDIPYSEWAGLISRKLNESGIYPQDSHIIELGCGTGAFTKRLADKGYRITGIDNSEDMLSAAASALYEYDASKAPDIMYSLQDMAGFEVPYLADGIVSVCDSVNYLIEEEDLRKCFESSLSALRSGGVFIFDMKKEEFYRDVLADNSFSDCLEDCAYIWDNHYDVNSRLNEYYLTVFIKGSDERYERFEEYHLQRAYPQDSVKEMLLEAGFINIVAFEDESSEEYSERVYFMAVRP